MKTVPRRGRGSLLLCVSLLLSLLLLTGSVARAQASAKANRASAEDLTQSLMALDAQYRAAPPEGQAALLLQLRSVAAKRQQVLSALVQTSPGEVLRVAIPGNVAAGLAPEIQSFVEQETDAQGELEVMYEDAQSGATLHHYLKTGGQRLELKFAANAPTNLLTGSIVHVHGTRVGSALALACCTGGGSNFQVMQEAPLSNTFGAQNTLVMLVNFQDNPGYQPVTVASVQNTAFTQASNFYLENSDQQTWLTGDVAGWYTIAVNSTSCDTGSIKTDAQAAAKAAGYNLANYTHYVYFMSSNTGCSSWWGWASIGGSDVWYNGEYGLNTHVFAHEIGHNFGLYHSHSYSCGTQVICSNGTTTEYGDPHDTMAAPYNYGLSTSVHPHFNSFQKERLGWLNSGVSPPILTATASGSYTVGPYENQDSTPKALKVQQSSGTGSYYYVEFRQPIGFDSYVSGFADIMNGVVIHQAAPSSANSSDLLDMTPTSPVSFIHPALSVGQSFYDSTAGVTITPVSANSTGATLQVTLGTQSCAHANPSLSMSPAQSAWVLSGTTVSFTATVTNNDSSGCSSSSFNLGQTVPSGWSSGLGSSLLTLAPGASGSTSLEVTSPVGTADGFYNMSVSATNASASAYSASASATYVISTPVPMSVTVSTDKSSYISNQTVTITVTVLSGSSPDSGASVSVSITPPKGGPASLTGTTASNGAAAFSYSLKKKAMTGTYLVQASPTLPGNGPTPIASTTFTVQ